MTWQAMDNYGLYGYCSYNITVVPVIEINGLQDINACVESTDEMARVSWNEPQASTLCAACPTTDYDEFAYMGDFYGNQYFLYTGEPMTWHEATIYAENLPSGHLLTVNNQAENNFIKYQLPTEVSEVWLGLQLNEVDNVLSYDWINDANIDYSK